MRQVLLVSAVGLAVFVLAAVWLGRLQQGGPPRDEIVLDGGIPATLYLPAGHGEGGLFLTAPPPESRPPAIALMHGYAGDRAAVSSLARGLAGAGYAVLSFEAAGHGANRNAFARSRSRPDAFHGEFSAAVDHLRSLPFVDGERIAVMGHSMGAGAALDFATRDSGLDAAVLVSGGLRAFGPHRPPNVLLIYAEDEVGFIAERSDELAAELAGVDAAEPGRLYGDPGAGTAVRLVVVPGVGHASIALSAETVDEVVAWLDAAFGLPPRQRASAADPRLLPTALAALSLLLVLPGLGVAIGRLVPSAPERPVDVGRGLASVALALFATLPLLGVAPPLSVLSVDVGDVVVSHLAAAGGVLLVWLALRGELAGPWPPFVPSALGAAAAVFAVFLLLQPLGAVVHRVAFTPERVVVFAAATLLLVPFALVSQLLLRRGPPLSAVLGAVAGRVLVLGALVAGVATGILSPVVMLMLPAFVAVFALFELLSAAIYAASRNVLTIALIDAALISLVVATAMPSRI